MHPARLAVAVVHLQQSMLRLAECASDVTLETNPAQIELAQTMVSSSLAEAGLQLLCAYTYVLYEQQQQQQGQPARSSSTSSSSSSSRQPVWLWIQDISPMHERLKLLPAVGRQLYLQAVRAVLQQQQQQEQQQQEQQQQQQEHVLSTAAGQHTGCSII
jgi:hypothetical protein